MYTASYISAVLPDWKAQGVSKAEIVQWLAEMCLGWQYVYASQGQDCTPSWRRSRIPYCPEQKYVDMIKNNCPVLSGKQPNCDGCNFVDTDVFDCAGFVLKMLEWAGVPFYGQGASTQWNTPSNWAARGEINTMPKNLVCCVYKRRDERMTHTGMSMGDGAGGVIHCSTTVKRGNAYTDNSPWTHWGIPKGLYTTEVLRKEGISVADNTPTLRRGSEGEAVEELQVLLNAKYGADLDVDGKFGAKTEAAVKAFQKGHGLTADGVVGAKTRKALGLAFDGDTQNAQNRNHEAPDNPENGGFDTDINVPDDSAGNISTAHNIWDRLMRAIGNPYGVAGLMGNLQAESGLNPENLQNTGNRALGLSDAEYTAAVDTGKYTAEQFIHDGYGYGLAQWTYYSRKANLLNFAVGKGCSIGDLDTQIEFLLDEIRYSYPQVWNMLVSTPYIREASDAVMLKYEKPANTSEENQARRAKLGQKFFDQFADVGKTSDPGPMDGPVGDPAEWDDEEAADVVWIPRLKLLEMQAALSDCLGIIKNALEGEI